MEKRVFLTAEWRNLINITYKTDISVLKPYLPKGLVLDTIDKSAFISLVAFQFLETRVKGILIPFHINFPEINLRFYVKNNNSRGVVFIREFVPKFMVSLIANKIYNEPYSTSDIEEKINKGSMISAEYKLKLKNSEYFIRLNAENNPFTPGESSTEHFFKEHTSGFGTDHSGNTLVYEVEHPVWKIYPVTDYSHNFDFGKIYSAAFSFLNEEKPCNVLFAEGSGVKVFGAEKLK